MVLFAIESPTLDRLRLLEEVDVLKHLSQAGPVSRHPNVLGYIDSWEQDDVLYIRTELCALGNFARFLWEYGRAFPRLDEARVWKIIVELSNVRLPYSFVWNELV
jgi:mitosis inhibitor protein kinase SWE1